MNTRKSAFLFALAIATGVGGCSGDQSDVPADQAASINSPPMQIPQQLATAELGKALPNIQGEPREPVSLGGGTRLIQRFLKPPQLEAVTGVGVFIGTYMGQSDGTLTIELCQGDRCAAGETGLSGATDNAFAIVQLDSPFRVADGEALSIALATSGASRPVAVWAYDLPDDGEQTSVEFVTGTDAGIAMENTSFRFKLL